MAVKIDLLGRTVSLGVGDLVAEPLASVGRVAGLSLWTRMALGREAHTQHQQKRSIDRRGYRREIAVRYTATVDGFAVRIQGRIDGVCPPDPADPRPAAWVVEEIKSVVVSPLEFAALQLHSHPHHLEQLRLYCYFVERESAAVAADNSAPATHRPRRGGRRPATRPPVTGGTGIAPSIPSPAAGPRVEGRLVVVNVADGARKEFDVAGPFDDCETMIAERVRLMIGQARDRHQGRAQRRELAAALKFPFEKPRKFQDEMIGAVGRTLAQGRHLLVSAPSGIGKTAGVLFPVLQHALAHDQRVFFVTAKNTQQQIVRETLERMGGPANGPSLPTPTSVSFRARERMCINQIYACREEFCPHLQMFQAKLQRSRALDRLLETGTITPDALMETGRSAGLCPFELALLEAERVDVVVCDYNYVFDPQVYLRRFFQDADYSDAILVIDEAHNLVSRAMDYYSPVLRRSQIRAVRKSLAHVEPALARDLDRFLGRLEEFFRSMARPPMDEYSQIDPAEGRTADQFLIEPPRDFFDELKPAFHKLAMRYLLDKIAGGHALPDDPVEQFFSDFGQYCSVLALEGEEFSHLFNATNGQSLKILCLDPARQLAGRIQGFHSVIAISATLQPVEFYRQMLGFDPQRTDSAAFPSPFPHRNRKILVIPTVSTTYQRRAGHYGGIAAIISRTIQAHRGNYMALFPSYEFLRAVADRLDADFGLNPFSSDADPAETDSAFSAWRLIVQEPKMGDDQRDRWLSEMQTADPPKLMLAVQGGLFAEGIDYPGEMLSGVLVISPALPQVSFEREVMRRYYDQRYGGGFEYAYLYPGMSRVIQSVGRLIRSETDRGVAVLICQRFAQPQYRSLFPPDWAEPDHKTLVCRNLEEDLDQFWNEIG